MEVVNAGAKEGSGENVVALMAVTSPDVLYRDWVAGRGSVVDLSQTGTGGSVGGGGPPHIETLLTQLPHRGENIPIITVHDGHPLSLAWLGGVRGGRVKGLGVKAFGQSGGVEEIYREVGIGKEAIVDAVLGVL
ncbi:hypothetical protein HK102_003978 [Quaeritorhiza haematococci]|nr:hypothetical protein HK102_003978 [Quaeritorhiza haematococci]